MPNTNPVYYSDHHTPNRLDTELKVLTKILGATIDGGGGGGGGTNNLSGTGSPVGVETPNYVGQTYTDLSGGFWTSVGLTSNSWTQIA